MSVNLTSIPIRIDDPPLSKCVCKVYLLDIKTLALPYQKIFYIDFQPYNLLIFYDGLCSNLVNIFVYMWIQDHVVTNSM